VTLPAAEILKRWTLLKKTRPGPVVAARRSRFGIVQWKRPAENGPVRPIAKAWSRTLGPIRTKAAFG
jgi:hypothetical protein